MTRRSFVSIVMFTLLATGFGPIAAAAQDKPDASGAWKWSSAGRDGGQPYESTLQLKQEGGKLTGALTGRGGAETPIQEGAIQGGEVTFKVTREFNSQKVTTAYKGKLAGDTITGTRESVRDGQPSSREWVAKRAGAKAGGVDPAGTWKWSFTIPNSDRKIESALRLKMVDGKLSGTLAGSRGETPIADAKLSGDEISFTVTREREGQRFTSKYAGKIAGDTIKGKIEFGTGDQARTMDWEAKREKAGAVTGMWQWSIEMNGQTIERKATLKQEGEKLTGEMIRQSGEPRPIENGKAAGNEVSFEITYERDGNKSAIKYAGKVEGDAITGKIESNFGGQERTIDWVAKRVKE